MRVKVLTAIQFNDQARLGAIKINDSVQQWLLSLKLHIPYLLTLEKLP